LLQLKGLLWLTAWMVISPAFAARPGERNVAAAAKSAAARSARRRWAVEGGLITERYRRNVSL
jgi:hypothetical protein